MLQPIPTRIYRITHLANLSDTLRHGIFCRNHLTPATTTYRNIGDASLTDRRNRIAVPLPPGGFLNDYVPFYLGPRSPMLYRIGRNQPQSEIIYLLSNVQHIQKLGLPYVFTDGHAFEILTSFHQSPADLANLAWADIYADQWKPTLQNPNLQRHKQAEFLVHQFVPVNALVGIAVYNSHIRTQVEQMVQQAGLTLPVREVPAWYY
jgi:hypothetical protein